MADESIADLSLADAARALAAKKFTSVEATEACLARLERFAPKLNCLAGLDRDGALGQARAADAAIAKGVSKPLLGVPLAHKDMYYRKGRESACGSKIRAGFVPGQTAFALEKLDAAGALDVARLAMVEFAARRATRGTRITSPADRRAGRASPSPGGWCSPRSVPIPADRSAFPRRAAAWSA